MIYHYIFLSLEIQDMQLNKNLKIYDEKGDRIALEKLIVEVSHAQLSN